MLLKQFRQNDTSWSEIASGFGEPGGTPLSRIPRNTPPPLPGVALIGANGQQERANCFATLLQKDLKSDVASFTTHIKRILQQIRLLTGLNEVGRVKRATSFFNSFCGNVDKLHVFVVRFTEAY